MPGFSRTVQGVFGVLALGGIVLTLAPTDDGSDLVRRCAKMLRGGARAARWAAVEMDRAAESLESKVADQSYVNQEWDKVSSARARLGLVN